MKRAVVITGLGTVTPLGENVSHSWAALIAGKRRAVGIETGKFPKLQGGANHHETMAGVAPRGGRFAFGLRPDFALHVIPDGFIGKGKGVGLMAKATFDRPGGRVMNAEQGLEQKRTQSVGGGASSRRHCVSGQVKVLG